MHDGSDRARGKFLKDVPGYETRVISVRIHPVVGACQLNGDVREENLHWMAIRCAVVVR